MLHGSHIGLEQTHLKQILGGFSMQKVNLGQQVKHDPQPPVAQFPVAQPPAGQEPSALAVSDHAAAVKPANNMAESHPHPCLSDMISLLG
jgi:hypothetical protein